MGDDTVPGLEEVLAEARASLAEGGAPFAAALVRNTDGVVLATGHNRHYQDDDVTAHAEMVTLRNAGPIPLDQLAETTMVANAIPCFMCSGAIVQLGIRRVVAGLAESGGHRSPSQDFLEAHGVEVVDLGRTEILDQLNEFMASHPDDWMEDLGAAVEGVDVSAAVTGDA